MLIKVLRTGIRDQKVDWKESNFKGLLIHEEPGILNKINTVIEWNFVVYPKKLDNPEEQDTGYLNFEQELKPGDAFSIGEAGNLQIFRIISNDKLGLEHTETGGLSLNRFIEKTLNPEFETIFNYEFGRKDVNLVLCDDIPSNFDYEKRIPFDKHKIWSERFFPGRPECENKIIKLTIESGALLFPIDIYIKKNSVFFDKDDLLDETDFVNWVIDNSLAWICNNYPRLLVVEKPKPEQNKDFLNNFMNMVSSSTVNNAQTSSVSNKPSIDLTKVDKKIYHWSIQSLDLGLVIYLVEKEQWNTYGCMDSNSLDDPWLEHYLPFPTFGELCEGVFEVDDKIYPDKNSIEQYLNSIDIFEYNEDFNNFCNSTN